MSKTKVPFLPDMKLNWKQVGLFKLATISFGILLAIYFYGFFVQLLPLVWLTCLFSGTYIAYVYLKK